MGRMLERRPSPAMVVALIALFVALSGTTFAALKVDSGDIDNNTIVSKDLKNKKAVKSPDVVDGSLTGTDVADGSLTGTDLTDGSLNTADLADNAVNGSKVANGSLTGDDVGDGSLGSGDIADGSLVAGDLADDAVNGAKVDESSLGKVPSASSADSATSANDATTVGGLMVKEISYERAPVSGAETILDLVGVKLTANCAAGAETNLVATTKQDSSAYVEGVTTDDANDADGTRDIRSGDQPNQTFDVGVNFDLDSQIGQGTAIMETGTFHYFAPDGSSLVAHLVLDEFISTCAVHGFAIAG